MAKSSDSGKKPLVFGLIDGIPIIVEYPCGASEVWKKASGRWAAHDADQGRLIVAGATVSDLMGWVSADDFTTSATEEASRVDVDIALDTLYEMPIDAAQTPAALLDLMWETCDLIVTANIQYADLDASAQDPIQLIDFRAYNTASSTDNTVIVRRVPGKIGATGVA